MVCYYKVRQVLLQSATGITKCDSTNINQTWYALFTSVTDMVSSDLWSQIRNALD